MRQILFNNLLILRCWWNDLRITNNSCLVYAVAMIQNTPRCLCTSTAAGGVDVKVNDWALRRFVLRDDTQGLVAGIQDFQAADDNALEGITANWCKADVPRGVLCQWRESVEVQIVSGQRSDKIWCLLLQD